MRNVGINFESFLEPTRIWLFGKPFTSLIYDPASMQAPVPGGHPGDPSPVVEEWAPYNVPPPPAPGTPMDMPPRRIERKLRRPNQQFARIYSFAFEGHYYKLPRPLLFLVSGAGHVADAYPVTGRIGFYTKFGGVDVRDWQFSDDILVWGVDRKDLAVCLDIEVGNYQEILLNSMIAWNRSGSSRGDVASRGDMSFRGDMTSRGDMASRGDMSFRGDIIGPHQNR